MELAVVALAYALNNNIDSMATLYGDGDDSATAKSDSGALVSWIVTIFADTELYRFETENTRNDRHKFYSYYRQALDPKQMAANAFGKRCRPDNCDFLVVSPIRPLRLIAIPYKSITMEKDVTVEDQALAALLLSTNPPPTAEQAAAVRMLILDEPVKTGTKPDWDLLDLICKTEWDGFVRVVNNTEGDSIADWIKQSSNETNLFDEIALCNADAVVRVKERQHYRPENAEPFVDLPKNVSRPNNKSGADGAVISQDAYQTND